MKIPQDMLPGTIHSTSRYGDFKILQYNKWDDIEIYFINTGYSTNAQASNIRNGNIKDLMLPSIFEVGFIGDGVHKSSSNGKITKPYRAWSGMMHRCYSEKTQKRQPTYKCCSVDPRWHNFQVFAKWFELNYVDGFQLDKDIKVKGNKIYSPETCIFVSAKENSMASHAKLHKYKNPNGEVVEIYNMKLFCEENGLNQQCMCQIKTGRMKNHNGWAKA